MKWTPEEELLLIQSIQDERTYSEIEDLFSEKLLMELLGFRVGAIFHQLELKSLETSLNLNLQILMILLGKILLVSQKNLDLNLKSWTLV